MNKLTCSELKYKYKYIKETGEFINIRSKRKLNRGSGCRYKEIKINGVSYYAHRLAWLYVYGEMPTSNIDHINGDGLDNRIKNLRLASQLENMKNKRRYKNNKTGVTGVYFEKTCNKYRARIGFGKNRIEIGLFESLNEAEGAVKKARASHGFLNRHGEVK